jgi:uncharacterized protein with PIN domain
MNQATFIFSSELSVFLQPQRRNIPFSYSFNQDQSVKHLIEAMGIPHTEVGIIEVNGQLKDFSYIAQDGDYIAIFHQLALTTHLTNKVQPQNFQFVLDNHLGKLASHLRMLGFDCSYENTFQDDHLALISSQENRILLSRDRRLFMRKNISQGYWLRSQLPDQQLVEVLRHYNLLPYIQPFTRCMKCNDLLVPVSKEAVINQLEPLTKKYFNEFSICPCCSHIYWRGSHYQKMMGFIENIIQVMQ